MDFPKDRDAPRSFVGRNAARSIEGDGLWLKKRRFDAVGLNRGGKLEVRQTPQQQGVGIVMNGAIAPLPANFLISVAKTEDSGFYNYDTGTTVPATTRVVGMTPMPIGRGYAFTYEMFKTDQQWISAEHPDIPGSQRFKYDIRLWLTRSGKTLDSTFTQPAYVTEITYQPLPLYTLGAFYVGTSRADAVIQTEFVGCSMDEDGHYTYAVHIAMFSDGSSRVTPLEPMDYRAPIRPIIVAPTPNVRIAMRRWMWGVERTDNNLPDEEPPVTFCWSKDGGKTWDDLDLDPFEDDFNALIDAAVAINATNFAPMLQGLAMQCVAINQYKALMRITCPYWDPIGEDSQERVKLFTIDLATGDTDSEMVVWDSATDSGADPLLFPNGIGTTHGQHYMTGGMISAGGGVLLSYIPVPLNPDGTPNYDVLRRTRWTADGLSLGAEHNIPRGTNRNGFITGADKKTLLIPVYRDDLGALMLYQTENLGETWEMNDAIAVTGLGSTIGYTIQNYATVYKIRNTDETPAHLSPATPWVRDARIIPPTP